MWQDYSKLSDEEILSKIMFIENKLGKAYNTSISPSYIDSLENTLNMLNMIQEERTIVKNSNNTGGLILETDPELAELENLTEPVSSEETTTKKDFSGPKIIKNYIKK